MRFVLNGAYKKDFAQSWVRFVEHLESRHTNDKNFKAPSKPGPGWLAEQALRHEICSATGMWDGEYVCCGDMLEDNYYCKTHKELYNKQNKVG